MSAIMERPGKYILLVGLLTGTEANADPWTSFPGTKARGMGTAFVAIANDPSSAWHNPAGLFQMKGHNVSFEGGNAPKYSLANARDLQFENLTNPVDGNNIDIFYASSWTQAISGKQSYFFSVNRGDGKEYGYGVYYYEPYSIETTQVRGVVPGVRGFVNEDVSILGGGYSGKLWANDDNLWFSSIHYGITLEWVDVDIGRTNLEFDVSGNGSSWQSIPNDSIDTEQGLTGAIGFLSTIRNGHLGENFSPIIKLGGVYRFDAIKTPDTTQIDFTDDNNQAISLETQGYFNAKPQSWDLGLAASMKLSADPSYGLLSAEMALQHGTTDFDSALTQMNYKKDAVGFALRWTRPRGPFLRQVELRLGYYEESSDSLKNRVLLSNDIVRETEDGIEYFQDGLVFPDVSGLTWGFQFAFDGGYLVEFAQEKRNLDNALYCHVTNNNTEACNLNFSSKRLSKQYWTLALRYNW